MGFERSKLGKKGHTPNLETNTWKLSVKVMTIKKTKKQELFCKQNTIHRERERESNLEHIHNDLRVHPPSRWSSLVSETFFLDSRTRIGRPTSRP